MPEAPSHPILFLVMTAALSCPISGCGAKDPAPLNVKQSVFPNIPEATASPEKHRTWADHYGGAVQDTEPTFGEAFLWREIEAGDRPLCKLDGKLTEGARRHAADLLESAAMAAGRMDRLRFTLHQLGVHDYAIETITRRLDPQGRVSLTEAISRRSESWTHCGLGIAGVGAEAMAVWIGVRRTIHLEPLPIVLSVPTRVTATGDLGGMYDVAVKAFVARPDHTVEEIPSGRALPGHFAFDMVISTRGRYELELLADTGHGLETVALLPLFAGVTPDSRPTVSPYIADPGDAPPEDTLEEYLNLARKKAGRAPLKRDPRLDIIARRHSEDMAKSGFFGHVSPTQGNLTRRLEAHRLSPRRFAENIAKSNTLFRIHHNLMQSPSHRIGMLSPRFTHVGIGVVRQRGELFATEVYAVW